MFNDFRLSVIRELVQTGLDDEVMRRVMGAIDKIGLAFDIERKCTALIPIEMTAQYTLMEYLACKSLEGFSKETLNNYHKFLTNFLTSVKKTIDDITTNDIRAYLYQYQQTRGISNRTLDHLRTTIAGLFHWAFAEGKISRDPSLPIHTIKYTVKPKPSLSQIELEYIRKKTGGPRERAIIEMMYSTGCRVSELCGMKRSDVDWDNGTIVVLGKGNKYRTVYMNAKAIVALRDYIDSRTDDDDHLFVSERKPHGALKRAAVEKIVRQISDRAFPLTGIHVTPHIFRHTNISTALRNGMPIQNVSKMAGHAQIRTTMGYAKIDNEDVQHDHSRYVI